MLPDNFFFILGTSKILNLGKAVIFSVHDIVCMQSLETFWQNLKASRQGTGHHSSSEALPTSWHWACIITDSITTAVLLKAGRGWAGRNSRPYNPEWNRSQRRRCCPFSSGAMPRKAITWKMFTLMRWLHLFFCHFLTWHKLFSSICYSIQRKVCALVGTKMLVLTWATELLHFSSKRKVQSLKQKPWRGFWNVWTQDFLNAQNNN